MLYIPADSPNAMAIVGIDPGTSMLGLATIWVDIRTLRIVGSHAFTLAGDYLAEDWLDAAHGARAARIDALGRQVLARFLAWQPVLIACESPFYSRRRPNAFGALTETIARLRQSVLEYSPWVEFHLVDPPTAKMAVGAPGNSKNKEDVKQALARLPDFVYTGQIPYESLDEHSTDACAIAYWGYRTLLERSCLVR